MADDLGIGIVLLEVFQQEEDGGFLGLGAGVGGAAFLIETTFVADADGVLVVVFDVSAGDPLRAAFVVFAVAGDVPVVAAVVGVAFGRAIPLLSSGEFLSFSFQNSFRGYTTKLAYSFEQRVFPEQL